MGSFGSQFSRRPQPTGSVSAPPRGSCLAVRCGAWSCSEVELPSGVTHPFDGFSVLLCYHGTFVDFAVVSATWGGDSFLWSPSSLLTAGLDDDLKGIRTT